MNNTIQAFDNSAVEHRPMMVTNYRQKFSGELDLNQTIPATSPPSDIEPAVIVGRLRAWLDEKSLCVSRLVDARGRFRALADRWLRETGMESVSYFRWIHPAYMQIISMGDDAIPLIFEELTQKPAHWLSALEILTEDKRSHDPVRPNATYKQAIEDWIKWGKENGYIR